MRYAEIHLVCQRLRCSVRVGDLPFGLFDWEPVRTATGFVIHISPPPFAEDWDSDMHSLMQAVTWNNPRSRQPLKCGIHIPSGRDDCEAMRFQPAALPSLPTVPSAANLPEPLQTLLEIWVSTATIADDATPLPRSLRGMWIMRIQCFINVLNLV